MALATVTGFLDTIDGKIDELDGVRLFFVPSGNAVAQAQSLLTITEPAQATVDPSTGAFMVQLQEQSGLTGIPSGDFWYFPRIEWLDPAGNFKQLDFIQWKVRVPDGGGDLADIVEAPAPIGSFVLGYGPPPDFLEDVFYIDRNNGDYYPPLGSF